MTESVLFSHPWVGRMPPQPYATWKPALLAEAVRRRAVPMANNRISWLWRKGYTPEEAVTVHMRAVVRRYTVEELRDRQRRMDARARSAEHVDG